MKGYKFYPYHSKEAQSVLSDILDGYFPFDLKHRYPDGVPLKPIDITDETYTEGSKKINKIMSVDGMDDVDQPLDKKDFFKDFPKNVIKDGKIIPIREELENKFRETQKLDLSKLNTNEPIDIPTTISKELDENPDAYTK